MNPWYAITSCTSDYKPEVLRLAESCIEHRVPLIVYPHDDMGSWVLNCEHTVKVMHKALWENPNHNILWLDADAIVADYPFLLDDFQHEIGVYKRKNTEAYAKRHQDDSGFHYESGMIFFRNIPQVREFLTYQVAKLTEYSRLRRESTPTPMKLPDYPSLNHLLRESSLDIGELPVSYHWPLNNPQPDEKCESPIIIQDMVGSTKRRER